MMTLDLIIAFCGFAFISSVTPGPNNLMLMTSGMNFGLIKSVPHMLGIGFGFILLLLMVGFGLGALFNSYPITAIILKIISTGYLIYLAWKIATTTPDMSNSSGDGDSQKPFSFTQALLFQWVNPKAWVMCITAIGTYAQTESLLNVLIIAFLFGIIMIPSISIWLLSGTQLKRILNNPKKVRIFNWSSGILLIASLIPTML